MSLGRPQLVSLLDVEGVLRDVPALLGLAFEPRAQFEAKASADLTSSVLVQNFL